MTFRLKAFSDNTRYDQSIRFNGVKLADLDWVNGMWIYPETQDLSKLSEPHDPSTGALYTQAPRPMVSIPHLATLFWQTREGIIRINGRTFENTGGGVTHPTLKPDPSTIVDAVVHTRLVDVRQKTTELIERLLELNDFTDYEVRTLSETGIIESTDLRDMGAAWLNE